MTYDTRSRERDRLNRRIRILPKELARQLKHYRNRISTPGAIKRREVAYVYVPKGNSGFFEGADVVALCHSFLDNHQIPQDPDLDSPKLSEPTVCCS